MFAVHPINNGLRNQPVPAKKKKTPPYPKELFQLHTLGAFIGSRGSGKTNACVLLAHKYAESGSFNRIFVISPTFESNAVFDVLPVEREDVYKDALNAQKALNDILQKIAQDSQDYRFHVEYTKIHKKFRNRGSQALSDRERLILESMQYDEPVEMDFPSPLIIIDDMSHSNIYSTSRTNPFVNLCLRHRHLHKTGVTLFMLVQNFKSGVPKCLRQNVQVFFIWRTQDRTQLDAIYQEFANLVSYEQFVQLYHIATDDDPHHFLTVDISASDPNKRFRKNFDAFIHVN